MGAFLRYRLLGRRPAPAYDGWLRDDLEGALYPWRAALVLSVVLGPLLLALGLVLGWSPRLSRSRLAVVYVADVVDFARSRTSVDRGAVRVAPGDRPDGPVPAAGPMSERLARSAAFWLRAYPPAWRAQRADEVTAVLVDLAPDGARRLDARTALNLVRGGVATRWRQTPPLRVYLPYRMLDLRVPARYREWVRQDIASPGAPAPQPDGPRLAVRAARLQRADDGAARRAPW